MVRVQPTPCRQGGQGPGWEPLTRLEPDPAGGSFGSRVRNLNTWQDIAGRPSSSARPGSYSVPRVLHSYAGEPRVGHPAHPLERCGSRNSSDCCPTLTYGPMPATNTQGNDPAARPRIQASILAEFPAYYHGSLFDIDCPSTTRLNPPGAGYDAAAA